MKILGIVPARKGSRRLPGKNMRLLGGRPLARWALDTARGCPSLTRLVVSSDDERVLELARGLEGLVALRRPPELSGDTAPAIGYVRHALDALEAGGEDRFEAVVILQPSSPFTLPADVEQTVALLQATGADSAVTVVQVPHDVHPAKFKVLEGDRLRPYFEPEAGRTAAEEMPTVYVRNGSVYATLRRVVDAGAILGDDCRGLPMPRHRSVDINDELDFALAELLLERASLARA